MYVYMHIYIYEAIVSFLQQDTDGNLIHEITTGLLGSLQRGNRFATVGISVIYFNRINAMTSRLNT